MINIYKATFSNVTANSTNIIKSCNYHFKTIQQNFPNQKVINSRNQTNLWHYLEYQLFLVFWSSDRKFKLNRDKHAAKLNFIKHATKLSFINIYHRNLHVLKLPQFL